MNDMMPATQIIPQRIDENPIVSAQRNLDALLQKNRLGMHVFETEISTTGFFRVPPVREEITNITHEQIRKSLAHHDQQPCLRHSASVLVHGHSMLPWAYFGDYENVYHDIMVPFGMYLLDLSQNDPEKSPRILTGADSVMDSGNIPDKKMVLCGMNKDLEFSTLYHSSVDPFKAAAADTQEEVACNCADDTPEEMKLPARQRGDRMIDRIVQKSKDNGPLSRNYLDTTGAYLRANEVIFPMHEDHVQAIACVLYTPEDKPWCGPTSEAFKLLYLGALYFAHKEQDPSWHRPVGVYDLNQPPDRMVTVLANTEEQVKNLVEGALKQLVYLHSGYPPDHPLLEGLAKPQMEQLRRGGNVHVSDRWNWRSMQHVFAQYIECFRKQGLNLAISEEEIKAFTEHVSDENLCMLATPPEHNVLLPNRIMCDPEVFRGQSEEVGLF